MGPNQPEAQLTFCSAPTSNLSSSSRCRTPLCIRQRFATAMHGHVAPARIHRLRAIATSNKLSSRCPPLNLNILLFPPSRHRSSKLPSRTPSEVCRTTHCSFLSTTSRNLRRPRVAKPNLYASIPVVSPAPLFRLRRSVLAVPDRPDRRRFMLLLPLLRTTHT